MNEDYLARLSCPYCGGDVKLEEVLEKREGEIDYAITQCECDQYPIIEGILVLNKGFNLEMANHFLTQRRFSDALNSLIQIKPFYYFLSIVELSGMVSYFERMNLSLARNAARAYRRRLNRPLLEGSRLTFFETIDALNWGIYGEYLKGRFLQPDLLGNRVLIHLLMNDQQTRKPVLDLCCGAGHHAWILSHYFVESNITCADIRFVNLLLTKRFFVKKANFICFDANIGLPFARNMFSTITCFDAFYRIAAKRLLACEFERVLDSEGVILLSSLPNRLKTGKKYVGGGEAFAPKGYSGLFENLHVRLIPEQVGVQAFLATDKIDLATEIRNSDLQNAVRLSLLATHNGEKLRVYRDFGIALFEKTLGNFVVNPIYRVEAEGNNLHIYKTTQSKHAGYVKDGWEQYVINKELLGPIKKNDLNARQLNELYQMWKNFVLIDAPPRYFPTI